jgi:hypothetical protein
MTKFLTLYSEPKQTQYSNIQIQEMAIRDGHWVGGNDFNICFGIANGTMIILKSGLGI